MPARWVLTRNALENSGSDSDEDALNAEENIESREASAVVATREDGNGRRVIPKVKLGGSNRCHVCGAIGHTAGFVGSVYFDCPNKPCYLCGESGHSTMTCPHRVSPGHGCQAAADVNQRQDGILPSLFARQSGSVSATKPPFQPHKNWSIDGAVLKLHSKRTTVLEFHPGNENLVLSGDKRGEIAVWDYTKVFERAVYSEINRWQTTVLRFLPGSSQGLCCASSSHDGTIKLFDPENGASHLIFNANAGRSWEGNGEMEDNSAHWTTMLGMDALDAHVLVAGDSIGNMHWLDVRTPETPVATKLIQKKGAKVQSVHVNPADNTFILAAGNDYKARVFDTRMVLDDKGHLAEFTHPKVINAAYFSPHSGRKIMTTCQDNRLRIYDNWMLSTGSGEADRDIVHSHTFNRYLSPFKGEWSPLDPAERIVVIGRYISEDFGGVALHPVDLLDVGTGRLIAELVDPNLTTISPVNKMHYSKDVIVSGSSRSLYAWCPKLEEDGAQQQRSVQEESKHASSKHPAWLHNSNYVFYDADLDSNKKKRKR